MSSPSKVIALIGPKATGKTTAANVLVSEFGALRYRFADKLKGMLASLGIDRANIDGSKKEEPLDVLCGKTGRYAMQTLGTEWRNYLGKNLWSLLTVDKIKRDLAQVNGDAIIVIDDLRFPHEVTALIDAFGEDVVQVWRIVDPQASYPMVRMWFCRRAWGRAVLKLLGLAIHESECWWPALDAHVEIKNPIRFPGSLAALNVNVQKAALLSLGQTAPSAPPRLRLEDPVQKGAAA